MRGWILLLVFLIWVRLTLGLYESSQDGLVEGFDANFKRLIPIDIQSDRLIIPPNLNNPIQVKEFAVNALYVPRVDSTQSSHGNLVASPLTVGARLTCPKDTLIVEGTLNVPSITCEQMNVNTLTMKGWTIRTDGHLHLRNGRGIQIAPDGNIHLDRYGWVTEHLINVRREREAKIRKEREWQAKLKREADEAFQRAQQAAQNAARSVGRSIGRLFSDRRLKTNIVDMAPMLDRILSLEPKEYNWIHQPGKGFGFIAQEVHSLFPEMPKFYPDKQGDDSENPVDQEGNPIYYGLDYAAFTPYLVKAIQEMKQQHDEQIRVLEKRIEDLETLIKNPKG